MMNDGALCYEGNKGGWTSFLLLVYRGVQPKIEVCHSVNYKRTRFVCNSAVTSVSHNPVN